MDNREQLDNIKWITLYSDSGEYIGVKLEHGMYNYYYKDKKGKIPIGTTPKPPFKLTDNDEPQQYIKSVIPKKDIQKLISIKQKLEDILKEPGETAAIETDYIPAELKKYNNDILEMLNNNIPEYVGDKSNLLMLILTVIAAKTGLASYIVNVTGGSTSGKTTLLKTLFKLIPGDIIQYHLSSTKPGLIRAGIDNPSCYNRNLIFLGNITKQRKKELTKIEDLLINLYKWNMDIGHRGSKTTTENAIIVDIEVDTFIALFESIEPIKSVNPEMNDIITYLTVNPVPKEELKQQQLKNNKNKLEFMEQHQYYINSLNDSNNIKEALFQNKELIEHIINNTSELTYMELLKYEMLYCSYCIYLNITPSIPSFKQFQLLTPKYRVLNETEKKFLKYMNKHYTNENRILTRQNQKKFKYFSHDMLFTYHSGHIKSTLKLGNLEELQELINSLIAKDKIGIKEPGIYYLIK